MLCARGCVRVCVARDREAVEPAVYVSLPRVYVLCVCVCLGGGDEVTAEKGVEARCLHRCACVCVCVCVNVIQAGLGCTSVRVRVRVWAPLLSSLPPPPSSQPVSACVYLGVSLYLWVERRCVCVCVCVCVCLPVPKLYGEFFVWLLWYYYTPGATNTCSPLPPPQTHTPWLCVCVCVCVCCRLVLDRKQTIEELD